MLIVEDDIFQSERLSITLIDEGASEVRCCTSASEALTELTRYEPAIIILDIHLADANDGWLIVELAQQIFPRMPLIVFATGSPERIPANIVELGILVVKPYDTLQLVDMIRNRTRRTHRSRLFGLVDRR